MAFPVQRILDSATTPKAGVTTGTSRVKDIVNGGEHVTFVFTSVGTTSGGTLLIEETDDPADPQTWSLVYTLQASAFTGGAKTAVHIASVAGLCMRVRVSADITGGGSVYVTVTGN
jgi:hypothetical protein